MKYGFLIPVYNHGKPCYAETESLLVYGLPIILVDDGSNEETKEWLRRAGELSPLVHVIANERNMGKGCAVINGIRYAHRIGLTHVLQLDADGQHDISAVPRFLKISEENPSSAVFGYPIYDETVPESRQKGRNVANFFCHFATMSDSVKDCMCGFRIYPVDKAYAVVRKGGFDLRMGFDIEIAVRLYWSGVRIISEGVSVTYPEGGTSSFHMVRDNVRISLVFTKLIASMLFHIPTIVRMRRNA